MLPLLKQKDLAALLRVLQKHFEELVMAELELRMGSSIKMVHQKLAVVLLADLAEDYFAHQMGLSLRSNQTAGQTGLVELSVREPQKQHSKVVRMH